MSLGVREREIRKSPKESKVEDLIEGVGDMKEIDMVGRDLKGKDVIRRSLIRKSERSNVVHLKRSPIEQADGSIRT